MGGELVEKAISGVKFINGIKERVAAWKGKKNNILKILVKFVNRIIVVNDNLELLRTPEDIYALVSLLSI